MLVDVSPVTCSGWRATDNLGQQRRPLLIAYRTQLGRRAMSELCHYRKSVMSLPTSYLVTRCLVGVTVLSGAAGEIENVNQVFQPDGRLAASNSPYPFRFRYPWMACIEFGWTPL